MSTDRRQRGFTLIELIMFIVIVGVALAGVLTVFNVTTKSSADPMVRKQALAIAEALLEEVMLQPFTWCDPSDATAATATSATIGASACTATVQGLGAGGSARIANTDNVGDYAGVTLNPVTSADGANAYSGYTGAITLTPESLGPSGSQISSAACASATDCGAMNVLRISVTVSRSGTDSITVEGYRTRHSPNMLP
jgi:MSHA pilin protein MshD